MVDTSRLPQPNADVWDWQREAACRGMNSKVFFHRDAERGRARELREQRAKEICRTCRVMAECRAHALAVEETYGVWGGLGEGELRELISRRRRAAARTAS